MKKSAYIINLRDRQTAPQTYEWIAGDDFFAAIEDARIQHGSVAVVLKVEYLTSAVYDLHFALKGQVVVACDRCMEPMNQEIEGNATVRVRLGEEDADDGDVITIPEERGTIDLQWPIYEQIALQVPIRHVHPEGECTGETDKALKKYAAQAEEEESTDPRWDALKGVLDKQ